ncbi:hypothetical protein [Streptomyces cinnamoneus]|uniref:hypothetical protein n=1 Tax=Streptomyces cinnamoneus TaxID=53446 RepID=UPI001EFE884B|nr:hypothetical protein [Streptomyces cinnamoneus]
MLYAPSPRTPGDPAADAELVRAGLRASAGRRGRVRAELAPRSAVRVRWAGALLVGGAGAAAGAAARRRAAAAPLRPLP